MVGYFWDALDKTKEEQKSKINSKVLETLSVIPQMNRFTIVLVDVVGMSVEDVSLVLKIDENEVSEYLRIGRKLLLEKK